MDTFWNGRHELTPVLHDLHKRHIPTEGPSLYLETELMRASARLSWDYFNNGFGNNMSQPVAYIDRYHVPCATPDFLAAWEKLRETVLWGQAVGGCPETERQVTVVAAEIIRRADTADREGTLTPRGPELFDMPYVESGIDLEPDEDEDLDYDEEELA